MLPILSSVKRIHSLLAIALVGCLSFSSGCKDKSTPAEKAEAPGLDSVPAAAVTPASSVQTPSQSSEERSRIGDKAKPLSISEWIKGTEVDVMDGKNIYVVEFWATWCGPCKTTIPHLTQLQKKYQEEGVVFIGISNESAEKVKPFVEEQAEQMDYTVALDKDSVTHKDYMRAYGQAGIPCAFVINKSSQVVWVGHPMELEKPLKEILAQTYDLKGAVETDQLLSKVKIFGDLLIQKDPQAVNFGEALLKEIGQNADLLRRMLDAAYRAQNLEMLDKVITQLEKADPSTAEQMKSFRTQLFSRQLIGEYVKASRDDNERAFKKVQAQVLDTFKGDPKGLVNFALQTGMQMSNPERIAFSMELVDAAAQMEGEELVPPADFYRAALSYKAGDFQNGDLLAEKALEATEDVAVKSQLKAYLERLKPAPAGADEPAEEIAEETPAQ